MKALLAKAAAAESAAAKGAGGSRSAAAAARPPYVTRGADPALVPEPPAPAAVYKDVSPDLHIGPMWSVPVSAIPPADLPKHLDKLTCAPEAFTPGVKAPTPFHIGFVQGSRLYMPPWYGKLAFPRAVPSKNTYSEGKPMRPEVKFEGKLMTHPPQVAALAAYKAHLAANPDCTPCIVSLPCGYGKTPWFLASAVEVGRVALMLVHKLPLLDQTIEEARRFLPAARVGYIRADRVRVKGVDIIVGSIQTLSSHLGAVAAARAASTSSTAVPNPHPYLDDLMRRVGMVCMDEGHHAIASTFATVFSSIPAKYRLVLTATPRRKDSLMPQLQMLAGPVIFRAFRQVKEVHVVTMEYVAPEHVEVRIGAMVKRWEMVKDLVDDETRTNMVCTVIARLLDQGRRILVVTPRVEHLHTLADKLDGICAAKGLKPRPVSMFVHDKPPPKLRRPPKARAKTSQPGSGLLPRPMTVEPDLDRAADEEPEADAPDAPSDDAEPVAAGIMVLPRLPPPPAPAPLQIPWPGVSAPAPRARVHHEAMTVEPDLDRAADEEPEADAPDAPSDDAEPVAKGIMVPAVGAVGPPSLPGPPGPLFKDPPVKKRKRGPSGTCEPPAGTSGSPAKTKRVSKRAPKPPKPPAMTAEEVDAANAAALQAWEDSGPHGSMQDFEAPVVGRVVRGMAQLDRELQYEAWVLVTTTQMMEEGISCKKLDTLIDTDNTRDPEQVVGRILRTCPDKRVPLIVDMWIDMFKGPFYRRLKYYRDEEFETYPVKATGVGDLPPPEFWAQFNRPAPLAM